MDDELEKYSGMSRYKMKLLREAKIVAIADFLACSDFQLSKMLKVKITAIEDIKDRIERKIKESDESLTLVNGSELLWYVLKEQKILITRIPQFDEIFAGGINGEHIEIIGRPGAGKTMLLNTMMINMLEHLPNKFRICFFDSGMNFQALKLKNMMDAREIPEETQTEMLKMIRVERVRTLDRLATKLKYIKANPKLHNDIKVIMIDSITSLAYFYSGNYLRVTGSLRRVVRVLKTLASRNIAILTVNLGLRKRAWKPRSPQRWTRILTQAISDEAEPPAIRPALGAWWNYAAQHKVLIDFTDRPHLLANDITEICREISLLRSQTAAPTKPKEVKITNRGVF